MRITNGMLMNNAINSLNNANANLSGIMNQMNSGFVIQRPSEDPIIAARALKLQINQNQISQHQYNTKEAMSFLELTESSLENMEDVIGGEGGIRENLVNIASVMTQDDRMAVYKVMSELLNQVKDSANSTYAGKYLFSGYQTNEPAYLTKDTELEESLMTSADIVTPKDLELEGNTILNGNTTLTGDMTVKDGSNITDINGKTYATGDTIPSGTEIVSGSTLGDGTILPEGTTIPSGTILPKGTTLPKNMANPHVAGVVSKTETTLQGGTLLEDTALSSYLKLGADFTPNKDITLNGPMELAKDMLLGADLTLSGAMVLEQDMTAWETPPLVLSGGMELKGDMTLPEDMLLAGDIKLGGDTTLGAEMPLVNDIVAQDDITIVTGVNADGTPKSITYKKGMIIPAQTNQYDANGVVTGTVQTVLPAGTVLPSGQTIKAGDTLPAGTVVPKDTVIPEGTTIAPNTIIPDGTALPKGTVIPSGTTLPEGTSLPAKTVLTPNETIPSGSIIPSGTVIPKDTDIPAGSSLTGKEQDIKYEIGVSTNIAVNQTEVIEAVTHLEKIMGEVLSAIESDDTDKLSSLLSDFDDSQSYFSEMISESGSRYVRLEYTEKKLTDDYTSMEELFTETAGIDIDEAFLNYTSQYTIYQSALQAAAKVNMNTLADYL
ncbi:MAG: hypothetical protein ATN32_01010 [Candidatus Epulonipiscium fishelsonii]|nr:MAG: hypothetical protein ATN32_01010 [Epulopiscium sp. AS2M-Bin002]